MKNDFWSARRWLARLSFSFLIVAAWLMWIAYQGHLHHNLSPSRMTLCYVAAFMALSLFFMGTRAASGGVNYSKKIWKKHASGSD